MMPIESVARTIQPANYTASRPVVMVTACAIIVSGLLSHYAAINERIRALTRARSRRLTSRRANRSDTRAEAGKQ
jgi:hypothetical protein